MNKEKLRKLVTEIYEWCKKKDLWGDNCIYFDGQAFASWSKWKGVEGKKLAEDLYVYEDKNPLDYVEYANPDTITMTFEGGLNHILNGYISGWTKVEQEFSDIFEKYGYYYEMGYSWSLSVYEN